MQVPRNLNTNPTESTDLQDSRRSAGEGSYHYRTCSHDQTMAFDELPDLQPPSGFQGGLGGQVGEPGFVTFSRRSSGGR